MRDSPSRYVLLSLTFLTGMLFGLTTGGSR